MILPYLKQLFHLGKVRTKVEEEKGTKLKKNFKVALSGEFTTNALLFKIAYPDAKFHVYELFRY